MDWERYIAGQEDAAYLAGLYVERTKDEFGNWRYFVTSPETGDWISDPFDTAEAAFDEIDRIRKESSGL